MASNLSALGFTFDSPDAFQADMLALAAASIERLGCPAGDYAIWRSRTGAEIWFHLALFGHEDEPRDIAGLTPFFEGSSEIDLVVTQWLHRPQDNTFEGACAARLADAGDGLPALEIETVDYAAHAEREVPLVCQARIVAFSRAIGLAPVGTQKAITSDRLAGEVTEIRHLTNEITGRAFVALVLDCGAATFDVVGEAEEVPTGLAVGSHIETTCRLFARLLD